MRLEPFKGIAPDEDAGFGAGYDDDWNDDDDVAFSIMRADVDDEARDEKGQWTSSGGGDVTTDPGTGLRTVSARGNYPEVREISQGARKSGLWQVTLTNGPETSLSDGVKMNLDVKSTRGGVTPEQVQHILGTTAHLYDTYTPGNQVPKLTVGSTTGGTEVYAETWAGLKYVDHGYEQRETVFSGAHMTLGPDHQSIDAGKGLLMPAFPISDGPGPRSDKQLDYIAAHEFGHILQWDQSDPVADSLAARLSSEASKAKDGTASLGRYGMTSGHEAYAECFADWYVSAGTSKNPATLALQKVTGWAKP